MERDVLERGASVRISHLMGICATEYGLSGEFPSGRSRFFCAGRRPVTGRRPPGFAGVASAKWPKPFAGIRSAMVQLAVGIVAACTVRPFPRGRVTMIQAGIHVGAGVVLGVAAGWWLGDWEQSLQVKDSVARVDCLLYGVLLVVLFPP